MLSRLALTLILGFAVAGCAGFDAASLPAAVERASDPPDASQRTGADRANPWAEPTRAVLIEHCGVCHVGTRPSANARALAIYNLAETPWDAHLKPHNYDGLTRRVNARANEEQKNVVAQYVRCARDGVCGEP